VGGVVSSGAELSLLNEVDPQRKLMRVTPGIRPAWHSVGDDQRRVMTPVEAISAGADLMVIGRPITAAPNPVQACNRLAVDLLNVLPR
ncbi:MAG: orotidine 5'-phosphate decarboxylase, partial [Deltaproteobacteria bacterium]|nr:orotidine 5'-phosphate decarboxylase [Deltaproteobacteria bacterium]